MTAGGIVAFPQESVASSHTGGAGLPRTAAEAAAEFESLLVAQLLKGMRQASASGEEEGWFGTGEDHSASSMMDVAEEHLARSIAAQGGLGLARLLAAGLAAEPDSDADAAGR